MNSSWRGARFPFALVALVLSGVTAQCPAQPGGIVADTSVSQLSYSAAQGLTPPQVWQLLDTAEFWAPPRGVPAGYYNTIDLSSRTTLRQTLHDRIAGHRVLRSRVPREVDATAMPHKSVLHRWEKVRRIVQQTSTHLPRTHFKHWDNGKPTALLRT